MKKILTVLAALLLATVPLAAQDVGAMPHLTPAVYALQGATVHTVSGGVLENATVVIRDGLIEAAGVGVTVPDDARSITMTGLHIYPGLIDALTEAGLKRTRPQSNQGGNQPGRRGNRQPLPENTEGPGLYTHLSAADLLDDDLSEKLSAWRDAGILALHVAPADGIFRGQSAVLALNSSNDHDRMIVSSPVVMQLSWEGMPNRTYPGSLMGVISHIRQTFLDAQHYQQSHDIYDAGPAGLKRPETDRALEALQPVMSGDMMAVFPAERAREIRRALRFGEEFGIKVAVAGGFEGHRTAEEIAAAGVPVLFSLNFPTAPRDQHPEAEESLSAIRYRVMAPKAAASLVEAGVKVAFSSGGARNPRDFHEGLRKLIENGLSKDDALRGATLSAAEILRVDRQLGSIEEGKIANLVVSDGDLFEEGAQIKHVFVDGEKFDIADKPRPKPGGGDGEPVDLGGIWDVTVQAPDGSQSIEWNLTAGSGTLTGTVSSAALGTVDIYDGTYTGSDFSFKITVDLGAGPTEITMSGSASGNSVSGVADVSGLGTAPFEGTKVP